MGASQSGQPGNGASKIYSVHSRLIGEWGSVSGPDLVADSKSRKLPRQSKHRIGYRHIIDWPVRKPGAFKSSHYRGDLFPTS
jgi:hypothetical protein